MGPVADVFVVVRPGEFDRVIRCVESVQTYLGEQCGRICIVTAALPSHIRQTLENLGCVFLNEADLLGETAAKSQQFSELLKWELRRFATTGTYLVVDADQILTRPTKLWHGDRAVLFCENRYRFGYYFCFNYFFGQIPQPASPASGRVVHFDRAVLEEMILKIQGRFKMDWPVATAAILQQVRGTAFDAAQIYASYLRIFRPGAFFPVEQTGPSGRPLNEDPVGVVRMSTLGYNGRFANQIFQYAYLQLYAKRHGLRAECPPWIGSSLFGHQTTLSVNELPIYREDKGDADGMIRFDPRAKLKNFELWGYFQNPRHWSANRQEFRRLFQPLPFLKKPLDDGISRLRAGGQTLVAIHLRRGDFSGGPTFWPAPEAWYLQWLAQVWPMLSNPVLYVATDDPQNVMPHFSAYQPKTTADLNVTVNGAEFYSDFYVLSQCDILGISNSTFSFAAAMMNTTATMFVRPDPMREEMVEFDPWVSDVQLKKPGNPALGQAA
jgi:hypothetical protein